MAAADDLDALTSELTAIVDEARAAVAAGRSPDGEALSARIRAAGRRAPGRAAAKSAERALQQLERVVTVHRARARLATAPPPPPPPVAPARVRARGPFRAQPTITGNMEVRRTRSGDGVALSWDAAPAVVAWDVRFSERPDARSEYVVRDERSLPRAETTIELTLNDLPQRVHILGRGNDGRLVRRAIVSALTRDNWDERWQRRASAS